MILIVESGAWVVVRTCEGETLAEGAELDGWDLADILVSLGHEVEYTYDRDLVQPPRD